MQKRLEKLKRVTLEQDNPDSAIELWKGTARLQGIPGLERLLNSGIFSGNKEAVEPLTNLRDSTRAHLAHAISQLQQQEVLYKKALAQALGDIPSFYHLENLVCTNANGQVFEQYANLYIADDIARKTDADGVSTSQHLSLPPYNAIVHLEQASQFLPSYALSCAIVKELFEKAVKREGDGTYTTLDEKAKAILDQYKDHGPGFGWHGQNTIIDIQGRRIIHYPSKTDFQAGNFRVNEEVEINQDREQKSFVYEDGVNDVTITDTSSNSDNTQYLRNLTGQEPGFFVELAQYFDRIPRLWTPSTGIYNSAWLGCYYDNLNVGTYYYLCNSGAFRGVQLNPNPHS